MHCRKGVALAVMLSIAWRAAAGGELVVFPERYKEDMHYATVKRGNITEELFTSRATIDAVKKGRPIPSGTVITMEDYRDGKLFRYVVMEKRAGWGAGYPPEKRNGEWEFQAFNADRSTGAKTSVAASLATRGRQHRTSCSPSIA